MTTLRQGVFVVCLCLTTGVQLTNGDNNSTTAVREDLHSSAEHLESAFAFDRLVGDALRYIPSLDQQSRRYLESYGWLVTDARMFGGDTTHSFFIGHPLHVFALIKRLVIFYPHIRDVFNRHQPLTDGRPCVDNSTYCDHWKTQGRCARDRDFMKNQCSESCGICDRLKRIKAVLEAEDRTVLPLLYDLTGAADAIGNLQKVYDLPVDDLTKGKIYDTYSSIELNEWDCARIARATAEQNRLSSAWLWYHHIRTITENPEMASYATEHIEKIAITHDKTWKNDDNYFEKKLFEVPIQHPRLSNFFHFCRGEHTVEYTNLKCELTSRGHPFFLLQPVKQEMIVKDPMIYMFHDVISDAEIETLKVLSRDNLMKERGDQRISQMAFLDNAQHPMLESLARRSSMLSGLLVHEDTEETRAVEPVKVRKYVTGGHLIPHGDVFYKNLMDPSKFLNFTHGDRMATVMFYLNDGFSGGRTAFYNIKVSLTPIKGSAVFWHNLKKNGDYDKRMDHGGCPVVLGTKWLALKWIREGFNFRTRSCSTVSNE